MDQEIREALAAEFSQFFEDEETSTECVISCGDGWTPLIHDLCTKLEALLPQPELHFSSMREMQGTLRISATLPTDEIANLVKETERKSEHTCEICGEPGRLHGGKNDKLMVRCNICWSNYIEA